MSRSGHVPSRHFPSPATPRVPTTFRQSRHHATTGPLLRSVGVSPTRAPTQMRKNGLPPPFRWLRVGRALHAALAIQHEPCRRILNIALELGFADAAALHHVLQDCFGIRPGALRQTVGWEWLVAGWVECRIGRRGAQDTALRRQRRGIPAPRLGWGRKIP